MKVLILDWETNSADAKTTQPTEIGAALFEYKAESEVKGLQLIKEYNSLIYEPEYPAQSQKIIEITGITDEMLKKDGIPRRAVLDNLLPLVTEANLCVAHKISFDKTVLAQTATHCGALVPDKDWLCTLTNFDWPKKYSCHKLGHLAWEHDIDVKASSLHRALDDVKLLAKLIDLYDFEQVLAYAYTPWVYVRGDILGPWLDNGVQNGIAKSLGFSWEQIKGMDDYKWPKTWVTRVKQGRYEQLLADIQASPSPFRISIIEGIN